METTFYELGERGRATGLMRVRREPEISLELAYFDGATGEYVVDAGLLSYLVLEDRDEAAQITTAEARRRESSIRRRVAAGDGGPPLPAGSE